VATDSPGVRDYLSRYWETYRHVKPVLTGEDLKAMGGVPGPIFRQVLNALRDARLDEQISSEAQERQMARDLLGVGT
jgi:tRNA nucleotidyltransferase (CCA-adding enzyme)